MDSFLGRNGQQFQYDPYDNKDRKDPARNFKGEPPNLGRWPVPTIHTFQGIVSSLAKTYRNPDEAIKHSLDNARFMRNDIGVMECLEQRQRCVSLLDWHIEVDGPDLPAHKALQERMMNVLRATPRFTKYRMSLSEAIWFGRSANQHRFGWKITQAGRDIVIADWAPINGDKLVFRQDDGSYDHPLDQIGVRVGAQFAPNDIVNGRAVVATEAGLCTLLAPYERSLIAVHKHIIEDAAYEDPLSAGSIHGIGIRSRIYWEWFQKQELLALFMEYLERAALGFEIWYYPEGNDQAMKDVKAAAENRNGRKTVILFPKPLGDDNQAFGVEHIEPGPAGAENFMNVLNTYFGHRIKRYILGQILTSEAEGTGLGSGVADLHLQTMLDIVKFDATNLEETITKDLLTPLKIFNDRNAHNVDMRFVIQTQTPDVEGKMEAYSKAWEMGAKLKESDVMEAIGAAIPEAGEPFLQNPQIAQAAMMGQDPGQAPGQAPGMPGTPHGMEPKGKSQASMQGMADQFTQALGGQDPQHIQDKPSGHSGVLAFHQMLKNSAPSMNAKDDNKTRYFDPNEARDESGEWTGESVSESGRQAELDMHRRSTLSAKLADSLPAGTKIKSGKTTWTSFMIPGEKGTWWQPDKKSKQPVFSSQILQEVGRDAFAKAAGLSSEELENHLTGGIKDRYQKVRNHVEANFLEIVKVLGDSGLLEVA